MISFRSAGEADVQAVCDLVNSAYCGESAKRGWTTESDLMTGLRTEPGRVLGMIQSPGSRLELAFSTEGALLGCVHLKKDASGSCYLGMLTVDPGRQAGGIGKLILAHSEEFARGWGCGSMRMSVVHVREELIQYYERRGYRKTGIFEPFPEDEASFRVPTIAGLKFLELVKPLA